MKHYCNPMNLEYKYQFFRKTNPNGEQPPFKVYREAADPSLILFKGVYYLFPSMTAGFFTSEDLHEWKFYELDERLPLYDYAPDVRVIGDYMYFSASNMTENCSFYRTKDPRTDEFEEITGTFPFWDPNLFQDDDGRVYFYWGCSNVTPIYGVELNPETMTPLTEPQVMFDSDTEHRGYERSGEEHIPPKSEEQIEQEVDVMLAQIKKQAEEQNTELPMSEEEQRAMLRGYFGNRPYIEGAWMTKHGGKYYLQYAIPGTQYNVYGDGVYISDKPLGPFKPQENNPYSYQPGGFITGAGHGSTLEDKKGDFWHIASMRISRNEDFERRLGIWKAGFDADGELFCDQRFGDWPTAMKTKAFAKPDWMLLSYGKHVKVSSGEGAEHITDEDIRTIWKAASNKPGEWAEVDLGTEYEVAAVQLNFQEDGILLALPEGASTSGTYYEERFIDRVKQKTNWLLEGSRDGVDYQILADKREADTDYSHDFLEFDETVRVRFLRLTIEKVPYEAVPAISGIRVFGFGEGELPGKAEQINIRYDGKMDMDVSWQAENTVGVTILWGFAPDKLYHSRMVYGKQEGHIGALVAGQKVYVRIDTFNEKGITEGDVVEVSR